MLKQTSSLTVREELVAVKGALELGFLSVQTLAPHWEKFYSTLARGNAGLLALLIEQGCLSESQVEFLKEGVEEDRQSHQLPQSVDIRNRKSVEKFLGTAERSSEPAQTASTARTKTGPQKAVVSKGTQQETVGQAAKKPAAVGQAAQSSGQAKKVSGSGTSSTIFEPGKKSQQQVLAQMIQFLLHAHIANFGIASEKSSKLTNQINFDANNARVYFMSSLSLGKPRIM